MHRPNGEIHVFSAPRATEAYCDRVSLFAVQKVVRAAPLGALWVIARTVFLASLLSDFS